MQNVALDDLQRVVDLLGVLLIAAGERCYFLVSNLVVVLSP